MATQDRERLGEHYDKDHLTHEDVQDLGLRAVTKDGEPVPQEEEEEEELQGKVFRFATPDVSGYAVRGMEETVQGVVTLTYLKRA